MSNDKDVLVDTFVKDVYDTAAGRGLTYGQLCQVAERVHLMALFYRFVGDKAEISDYLRKYGEHVAGLIDDGTIEFVGDPKRTIVH